MTAQTFGTEGSLPVLADLACVEALIRLGRPGEARTLLAALTPKARAFGTQSAENGSLLLVRALAAPRRGDPAEVRTALDEAEAVLRALGPAGAGHLENVAQLRREEPQPSNS